MRIILSILGFGFTLSILAMSDSENSRRQYGSVNKDVSNKELIQYRIQESLIFEQRILPSSNGYSDPEKYSSKLLSMQHYIKWTRAKINTDDRLNIPLENPLLDKNQYKSSQATIILHENKVRYVIAQKGDSYYKISKRTRKTLHQLHAYNEESPKADILEEGSIVYIDPRRMHSIIKNEITLEKGMTLREIAQKEAVKLRPLMKRNNNFSPDEQLPCGERIFLR